MIKKEYILHFIFALYAFFMLYLSIHYWKKLGLLEKQLDSKIITKEDYRKKRQLIVRKFNFMVFLLVISTFILMILYSQWAY